MQSPPLDHLKTLFGRNGPGVVASLLLHGLALLLILLLAARAARHTAPEAPILPVDLVRLGQETLAPAAAQKSAVPQQQRQQSRKQEAAAPSDERVSPAGRKPAPRDTVEAKIRDLARLREPDVKLPPVENPGASNVDASNGAGVGDATYSLSDLIRAQIERRWSLDLATPGVRGFIVPIHIVLKPDGTVVSVDIVETARARKDKRYRDVAISARNAALLSSPLRLPPGDFGRKIDLVIALDPQSLLR